MSFITAAITAAAAIGGSLISADASRSASNTQADAARNAQDTQWRMFNQTQGNLAPFLQGGTQGQNALLQYLGIGGPGGFNPNAPGVRPFGMGDFQTDPSYQWRLGQGEQAIMANRAASGGIQSGQTLKDLTTFGQGMASQEYGNAFNRYRLGQSDVYNRLSNLASTGQNAAVQQGGFGQTTASNVGGLQTAIGADQAAGILGQANSYNRLLGTLAGIGQQGFGGGMGAVSPWQALTYANPLFGPGMEQFGGPGGG